MGVVRRRDLEAACSEIHLDIAVFNDGDLPVYQGDQHLLAAQVTIALVGGVDADRRVGHDGLGARGRNGHVVSGGAAFSVADIIFKVIEMALGVLVNDLVVADRGERHGIPVDHAHSPVDHALLVEPAEGCRHGLGELRLHREAGAVPVAGGSELAQLLEYDSSVLLLPFPGVSEELLAREVILRDALLLEARDHLGFGGDAGMVGAGNPARVPAVHAGLADQHVVECVVEHMAHVEYARHVGRGDHHGIGFPVVGLGVETSVLQPVRIPFVLDFSGVVFSVNVHRPRR